MKLYLLRHAEAEDGLDDAARALTSHGRKQARAMAQFLAGSGIQFDAAYSSPLVRAVQTAEAVLPITNPKPKIKLKIVDSLLNQTSSAAFDHWLKKLPDVEHVLLVGHAPSIAERAAHLTGGTGLKMPKGSLVCVEAANRVEGLLRFFVTPKLLGCKD